MNPPPVVHVSVIHIPAGGVKSFPDRRGVTGDEVDADATVGANRSEPTRGPAHRSIPKAEKP